ncbi:serine hydrolase [Planobispora siamensis]|uniref:Beta-lactamase-related domain-containing protein n=1 Tax=Planobispora siamensis TaxID=936338 RepID=A0A8J3SBS0_9ACTN|nr:serine hydrolase domain-containing protein [Planobispora siamensis]GIH91766.1 hypothetical protein Psi01_23960 [Planobispora siamensis]
MNRRTGARMDVLVKAYERLGRFSGSRFSESVLVARGGRVLLSKGYGPADHGHGVPGAPRTAFRIGSQAKAFTAIAILQLQERGLRDCSAGALHSTAEGESPMVEAHGPKKTELRPMITGTRSPIPLREARVWDSVTRRDRLHLLSLL